MRIKVAAGVALAAALVLVAGAAAHPFDASPDRGFGGPPRGGPGHGRGAWFADVCDRAVFVEAACSAEVVTDASGSPLASSSPPATALGPDKLRSAYGLTSLSGSSSQTIGIVDAYDDPNAESDLGVFSTQYGLPSCTTANGCFRKVSQTGTTRYPRSNSGWALEISLDIETAHGICPGCKILLVEASSASMSSLGASVNEAVKLGATEVSNSYGGGESSLDTSYDSAYFNHPGVAITVSSGDSGYGVEYPAASQYVTAVGGTTLNLSGSTYVNETAWSSGGSGCSRYDAKPSWQTDTGCSRRTVADVSADADPNTGAAVYDSVPYSGQSGWFQVGGTSLSSPLIAAVYALAGNAASVTYGSYPYSHVSSLHDVLAGSNGSCSGSYLCTAGSGYDGPTGLGSPNGVGGF